jgi:hypothetical protein
MNDTTNATTTGPDPGHDDAHDLMPTWLATQMPALYATEGLADPPIQCKYFTPDSAWTWYVLGAP